MTIGKKLTHVAVYTQDIDASIQFYCDVFGFDLIWKDRVEVPNGIVTAAMLKHEDANSGAVGPFARSFRTTDAEF